MRYLSGHSFQIDKEYFNFFESIDAIDPSKSNKVCITAVSKYDGLSITWIDINPLVIEVEPPFFLVESSGRYRKLDANYTNTT